MLKAKDIKKALKYNWNCKNAHVAPPRKITKKEFELCVKIQNWLQKIRECACTSVKY